MPDRFMSILAPNFAADPGTGINGFYTLGTPATLMPVSNLLTEEPSDRSRLLTHDPLDTYWLLEFNLGSPAAVSRTVQELGLVNCNLSRFGMYRFLGDPGAVVNPQTTYFQELAPSAVLASSNLTGAVTNIDESPRSPDGLWCTPTTASTAWSGRWSFPTPAVTPATGAYKQAFVLWARRVGGGTSQYPVLQAELWENGVFRADLGTKIVSQEAGQILIFRWNASLLSTASGADVEVKVQTSGSVLWGVGVDLGALCWRSEKSTPVPAYDSGWLASPFDSIANDFGNTSGELSGPEPVRNLSYQPATAWTIRWWIVALSDDQSDDSQAYSATKMHPARDVKTPDGYAQGGHAPAGPIFTPSGLNFAKGPLLSARDPSPVSYTLGGQECGSRRRPRRVMPVVLSSLSETEGFDLFDRIDWRKGKKLPMLVVKYPDKSGTVRRHTTLWCTLEDMPGLTVKGDGVRQSWFGLFVEKL